MTDIQVIGWLIFVLLAGAVGFISGVIWARDPKNKP